MPTKQADKTTKKQDNEEKDGLGFRKKDYPIIGFVALLALNIWAFNTNTTSPTGMIIAICVDLLVAFWIYKKFFPKKETGATKDSKPAGKGTKAVTKSSQSKTTKKNDTPDELGIFGLKKKHYPTLAIAIAAILTFSAVMNRTVPLIITAGVVDVAIGYWYFKKRSK